MPIKNTYYLAKFFGYKINSLNKSITFQLVDSR